jgi:oxaloacetate decarboxylase gamma subunit
MPNSLIDQGLSLMLYGMGTVFCFLTILVFATLAMSRLVARFANDGKDAVAVDNEGQQPSAKIKYAIQLAIAQHRQR